MTKQIQPDELSPIVRQLLIDRGYKTVAGQLAFLNPDYQATNYDPYLLHDMRLAVDRLLLARDRNEQVTIYCDYDVDGATAAALLLDALPKFNIKVNYYVPDRFTEGYGLNKTALDKLKQQGTDLILTVDNGIVSFDEAEYASRIGLDLIITDHHTPREQLPMVVAVVNPKITNDAGDLDYPFTELCGCAVAFKLVQALQQALPACLPLGQEKWLLDLVAVATVADIVPLIDENRTLVYWGLKVLAKTRRPGLKVLAGVAGINLDNVDASSIGFVLGPRINAAGRLANAQLAIELLSTTDGERAWTLATELNDLNNKRKSIQTEIYQQAITQINTTNPVAIAIGDGWHEGVIGIVASKVQESVEKPTFIFSRNGESAKASGRSFGDFSIASAINATSTLLEKGGGHAAAGGVTVSLDNFDQWCQAVNDYYRSLNLINQVKYLYPTPDIQVTDLSELTPQLVDDLNVLAPFGTANPLPTFLLKDVVVVGRRLMGNDLQHVRYTFRDTSDHQLQAVAFNAADRFTLEPGEFGELVYADVLVELSLNEWNDTVSVQGKLLRLERA